jgi:hypothetical protein
MRYEYGFSLPQRTFRFLQRSQLRPRRVLEVVVDDPGVALLRYGPMLISIC